MPNQLSDVDVAEVSLVPKGANLKKFYIMKEDVTEEVNHMDFEELLKALADQTTLADEAAVDNVLKGMNLSEKSTGIVKGVLRLLSVGKEELPADIAKTLGELTGYKFPEPTPAPAPADVTKEDTPPKLENVPPEVRESIETLWKEHRAVVAKSETLEKELKTERDKALTREYIGKAAEFGSLATAPEDLGPVLKVFAEADPVAYATLEGILKGANEALKESKVLAEFGSSAVGGNTAQGKLEQLAKSYIEKDAKMTKAQAFDRALKENPELYSEYLREQVGEVK